MRRLFDALASAGKPAALAFCPFVGLTTADAAAAALTDAPPVVSERPVPTRPPKIPRLGETFADARLWALAASPSPPAARGRRLPPVAVAVVPPAPRPPPQPEPAVAMAGGGRAASLRADVVAVRVGRSDAKRLIFGPPAPALKNAGVAERAALRGCAGKKSAGVARLGTAGRPKPPKSVPPAAPWRTGVVGLES